MTDPTGRSFLSYRRARKDEAALLITAQHDYGIPTWQDIHNLDEEHTEEEIRRVLDNPLTSNAVLWITPEVAHSTVIRKIEVPKVLNRLKNRDGFFIVPAAAGGLGYKEAADAIDQQLSVQNLGEWNMRKVDANPIEMPEAVEIAKRVLRRRLAENHKLTPTDDRLKLGIFTRTPTPFEAGTALLLDWSEHFKDREALPGVWQQELLPALLTIAETVSSVAPGRGIEARGLAAIPAVVALGAAFLAPRAVSITWRQVTPGREDQLWSIETPRKPAGFVPEISGKSVDATNLAVLVSVANDVEPAFAASCPALPSFRAVAHIRKPDCLRFDISKPGQATDIAHTVAEAIRRVRQDYRPLNEIHLFMAVPVGLAMLIGQLLNTFGPIQTYEHIPSDSTGRYRAAAKLHPSR